MTDIGYNIDKQVYDAVWEDLWKRASADIEFKVYHESNIWCIYEQSKLNFRYYYIDSAVLGDAQAEISLGIVGGIFWAVLGEVCSFPPKKLPTQ